LRLPFWRPWSGQPDRLAAFTAVVRLGALIVIEVAVLVLLLIVVGTVVIPLVEPALPTPVAVTPTSAP
jgi:hypothetical protein